MAADQPLSLVLALVDSRDDATRASEVLAELEPSRRAVGVIVADSEGRADAALTVLRGHLDEIICCDEVAENGAEGGDLAMRALEVFGYGQDFVFQIGPLEQAIDRAIHAVTDPADGGWEGEYVLVAAPASAAARIRTHLLARTGDREIRITEIPKESDDTQGA